MQLNENKSNLMIFNLTDKYQFSTRIFLENSKLEIIEETKLLGCIITSDLTWHRNTEYMVKKAFQRMEILRRLYTYVSPMKT